MGRRCVVAGCTSKAEEKAFLAAISKHGHAYCPVHFVDSAQCKCTKTTKLFSGHSFPLSPELRQLWYLLLKLEEDYCPKTNEIVCSKHFEGSKGQKARYKIPTLNIDRPDSEIQQLLKIHVSSVINQQAEFGLASPLLNAHLANAMPWDSFSLVTAEKIRDQRNFGSDEERFLEEFDDAFRNDHFSDTASSSASPCQSKQTPLIPYDLKSPLDEHCYRIIIENYPLGQQVRCNICLKEVVVWFRNKAGKRDLFIYSALAHAIRHTTTPNYGCRLCDYTATVLPSMHNHLRVIHNAANHLFTDHTHEYAEFILRIITMCFENGPLKREDSHTNVVHDPKAHQRHQNVESNSSSLLPSSQKSKSASFLDHYSQVIKKSFKPFELKACNICKRKPRVDPVVSWSNWVLEHAVNHMEKMVFWCRLCNHGYPTENDIQIHMRVCHSVSMHPCKGIHFDVGHKNQDNDIGRVVWQCFGKENSRADSALPLSTFGAIKEEQESEVQVSSTSKTTLESIDSRNQIQHPSSYSSTIMVKMEPVRYNHCQDSAVSGSFIDVKIESPSMNDDVYPVLPAISLKKRGSEFEQMKTETIKRYRQE